jgi:hypothetical protein
MVDAAASTSQAFDRVGEEAVRRGSPPLRIARREVGSDVAVVEPRPETRDVRHGASSHVSLRGLEIGGMRELQVPRVALEDMNARSGPFHQAAVVREPVAALGQRTPMRRQKAVEAECLGGLDRAEGRAVRRRDDL